MNFRNLTLKASIAQDIVDREGLLGMVKVSPTSLDASKNLQVIIAILIDDDLRMGC